MFPVALGLGLFAATIGVVVHRLIFIKGEWHLHTPHILFSHLGIALALLVWLFTETDGSPWWPFLILALVSTAYLSGLFGSIVYYRLYQHRLRRFPGPRLAAVSKLWHVWKTRDSRNHLCLEEWHKKYGTFVRTGPEEITIFHPAAWEILDGSGNRNIRTDWYDLLHPSHSPPFVRDPVVHLERRKIWTLALSTKAIEEYLPRIMKQISVLEQAIKSAASKPVLLNELMLWFTFDSMGEFAFNQSFGMMKANDWHEAVFQQRSALSLLGPFSSAPWAIRFAFSFGLFFKQVRDFKGMIDFCTKCMDERLASNPEEPDISTWFLEEFHENAKTKSFKERRDLLVGNAVSVVVGGSDTTGSSLILLWYSLAKYPEHARKIYAELRDIDETDVNTLAGLTHLNAFINEVMRITAPAPTMGVRVASPEGLWIDDTFIPGGTKCAKPQHSICRLESAFERPLEFIPERWTTSPELIKDKRAFAPFGVGRRGCVGKNLALTQLRLVVGILLKKYSVSFAPGQDVAAVERYMQDQVTAQPGPCRVIFQSRAAEKPDM